MEHQTWPGQAATSCGAKQQKIGHSDPILVQAIFLIYEVSTHTIWLVRVSGYR